MRINSININHNEYKIINNTKLKSPSHNSIQAPCFKGDSGALVGIFSGALFGAGVATLLVATGGLAGMVAAAGAKALIIGGTAVGTHVGGITGGFLEDKANNDDKNK